MREITESLSLKPVKLGCVVWMSACARGEACKAEGKQRSKAESPDKRSNHFTSAFLAFRIQWKLGFRNHSNYREVPNFLDLRLLVRPRQARVHRLSHLHRACQSAVLHLQCR